MLCVPQEYCSEGSLADAIKQRRFWDMGKDKPRMPSILGVAADVAAGMAHIHSRNIIHGDLKCTNVLLKIAEVVGGGAGSVVGKIADFGLSVKLPRNQTHISNFHAGTPFYAAPEVVSDGKLSKKSDVFAFGVILWELFHHEMTY